MSNYSHEIDKMTWSFSRCNCFQNCKYEWYLSYLTDEAKTQNFYGMFGGFCHELLEQILSNKISVMRALELYIRQYDKQVSNQVNPSTYDKYFKLGKSYFQTLNLDWLQPYEVLGIEKKVAFTIGKRKFIGYIDLLLREKETGKIIIVDHKSSEYPIGKKGNILKRKEKDYENYKRQLYIYAKAIYDEYEKYPSELWWNYFKEKQWVKLPFIESEYQSAVSWAESTIQSICGEEEFPPSIDYFYCKNLCNFRSTCDYILMKGS